MTLPSRSHAKQNLSCISTNFSFYDYLVRAFETETSKFLKILLPFRGQNFIFVIYIFDSTTVSNHAVVEPGSTAIIVIET